MRGRGCTPLCDRGWFIGSSTHNLFSSRPVKQLIKNYISSIGIHLSRFYSVSILRPVYEMSGHILILPCAWRDCRLKKTTFWTPCFEISSKFGHPISASWDRFNIPTAEKSKRPICQTTLELVGILRAISLRTLFQQFSQSAPIVLSSYCFST